MILYCHDNLYSSTVITQDLLKKSTRKNGRQRDTIKSTRTLIFALAEISLHSSSEARPKIFFLSRNICIKSTRVSAASEESATTLANSSCRATLRRTTRAFLWWEEIGGVKWNIWVSVYRGFYEQNIGEWRECLWYWRKIGNSTVLWR